MPKKDNFKTIPFTVIFNKNHQPKVQNPYSEAVKLGKNQSFFWHNINYLSHASITNLCSSYGIDQDSIEALIEIDTRPRYFSTPNGIVFILRVLNPKAHRNEEDMISIRFWVDSQKVISLSNRRIPSVDAVLAKLESSTLKVSSPMECFLEIADQIAADIVDFVSDITDAADELETHVISADSDQDTKLRSEVSRQRRKIVSIRRYLVPMQNIFINIKNEKIDWLTSDDRTDMREIYNNLTKSIEDLDYARDRLLVSFEELQSKVNVRISRTMYFFSVVTVIFLPLTFVTGLLGINVAGIPFSENRYAFATVSGILLLTAIVFVLFLKKKKWI